MCAWGTCFWPDLFPPNTDWCVILSNPITYQFYQILTLDTLLPKKQRFPVASREWEHVEMCPEARKVLGEAEGMAGTEANLEPTLGLKEAIITQHQLIAGSQIQYVRSFDSSKRCYKGANFENFLRVKQNKFLRFFFQWPHGHQLASSSLQDKV